MENLNTITELFTSFQKEIDRYNEKGIKSALVKARKASSSLGKELAKFRKESVALGKAKKA